MGAEPYEYLVDYEEDVQAALDNLRRRVFETGEYRGADLNPTTPEEALEMSEEDGTASILDIERISDEPDFCAAAPYSPDELRELFGSETPAIDAVKDCDAMWEGLERGQARYVIVYNGGVPDKIFFAGYSFD